MKPDLEGVLNRRIECGHRLAEDHQQGHEDNLGSAAVIRVGSAAW